MLGSYSIFWMQSDNQCFSAAQLPLVKFNIDVWMADNALICYFKKDVYSEKLRLVALQEMQMILRGITQWVS